MKLKNLIYTGFLILTFGTVSHAADLAGYTITKLTDGPAPEVTRGKNYSFEVQAIDNTGAPATIGQSALINLTCDGVPCTVIQPTGGGPYQPNVVGRITFLLRFDVAPDSVDIIAFKSQNSSINGTLSNLNVQPFPSSFNIALPNGLNVNAGVPFPVVVTAVNGGTITSFKDTVTLSDGFIGDLLTIPGSSFTNGSVTTNVTLFTGNWTTHVNNIYATNTVTYVGQGGGRTTGKSNNINVAPGAYDRVIMLFPGESPNPGIPPGKTGVATDQVAGTAFAPISVFAVDAFYNRLDVGIPGGLNISFNSTVGADTLPGATPLISNPLNISNQIILNPPLGDRSITAIPSINSANTSQSTVEAIPGQVAYYLFTVQPPTSGAGLGPNLVATVPFAIEITAFDSNNNVQTNVNGNVNNALKVTLLPAEGTGPQWVDTNPNTPQPNNQLTFVNGVANKNIVLRREWNGVQLTFDDNTVAPVNSNIWNVVPGPASQILMAFKPDQTFLDGEYPGVSGIPSAITAGTSVRVELRITDASWNVVTGANVDSTDVNILADTGVIPKYIDVIPAQSNFPLGGVISGGAAPLVTFRSAGNQFLRAQASGSFSFLSTSFNSITVNPGGFTKMLLVGPGETAHPGIHPSNQPDGKVGSVSNQSVGVPFTIRAMATDNYWNPVITAGFPQISFNFDDPNYTLRDMGNNLVTLPFQMGGAVEDFRVTLEGLNLPNIELFDNLDQANANKHSIIAVNMNPGVLDHFRMTIAALGAKTAGVPFQVTIQAEDVFNNVIPTDNGNVTLLSNTGATTMTPEIITLTNGVFTGDLTVFTATPTARIQMSRGAVISQGPAFTVNPESGPSAFKKLILLLPGETMTPGMNLGTVGKSGSPTPVTVGVVSVVRAIATDGFFNPINVTGVVQFASDKYSSFGAAQGSLVNVQGFGEYSTTMILRTAGAHNVTVREVNLPNVQRSTSIVSGLVGTYRKIQLLAPGEVADPGTFTPNGKTSVPPLAQETGKRFTMNIRAVDDFWNLVPFNGGDLEFATNNNSKLFIPPNNAATAGNDPRPFTNGLAARDVIIGEQGLVQISVIDKDNLTKPGQTVELTINPGPVYTSTVPAQAVAGQAFSAVISLSDNGVPLAGYNESIFLSAVLANGSPARGAFNANGTPKEYVLNNGVININDLVYNFVETIQIKVADNFGREFYSQNINMIPSGLKYKVDVPVDAVAGPPSTFTVTVSLLEENTNTLVMNRDHEVLVNVVSAVNPSADGIWTVVSANLANGVATFQQSYSKAESILIQIAESPTNGDPGFVIPPRNSNNINIKADGYKKLLILAPGETQVAGVPSATGKTGIPFARQLGVPFLVQVRGVDQYWNVSSEFNGGTINYSATKSGVPSASDISNQNVALNNGETASFVTLFETGDVGLSVRDLSNPQIGSQLVQLVVGGNFYQVTFPSGGPFFAGTDFTMNITLIDFNTGLPVIAANNEVQITAILQDGTTSQGLLGKDKANLNSGTVGITDQSYNRPEKIKFRIRDNNGNVGDSAFITFNSIQIRYEFTVPETAEVFKPFPVTIRTIDNITNQPNFILSGRINTLEAISALTGLPVTGTFNPNVVTISSGVATFQATYNVAEPIFLRITDTTPSTSLNPPASPSYTSAGIINVKPGALNSVDINDFTMQSNSTRTFILIARDSFSNPIPEKTLNLTVVSITPPGQMNMNGQPNFLSAKTNAFGELQVTFDPTNETNGLVEILISDGDNSQGLTQVLNITVLGLTVPPAQALGLGGNRIPVNGTFNIGTDDFMLLNANALNNGGTINFFFRIDRKGGFLPYDPNVGIVAQDFGTHDAFLETRDYIVEWFSEVCYPGTQPCVQTSIQTMLVQTINPSNKLVGFPSPFNPTTDGQITLMYPSSVVTSVEVDIYDLFGQKVRHMDFAPGSQTQVGNNYQVFWNGQNEDGITVANGGYIVLLKVGATGQTMRQKILVVK